VTSGIWSRLLGDRAARTRRTTFGVYATIIFVLTHWPKLEVPIPVHRPDIIAHIGVFGLWTVLCVLSGWFGLWSSPRNILISAPVAAAYSGIDEWLQAIPFIRRQAAWDDFAANLAGVILGVIFASLLGLWWRRRTQPRT
jgi:VanZ family protein